MNWDEVKTQLQKPLHPDAIHQPAPGKYGEYIDGLHAIREANRIFGEDGWTYEITRLEMVSRLTTAKPQLRVGYMCTVRVSVDGVVREGSAVGSGMVNPDNEADAHESAIKEAETDAMKRALRSFGNTFGLALYEKDKSKREVGTGEPEFDSAGARDRLLAEVVNCDTTDALNVLWRDENETLSLLSDTHFKEVKAAFAAAGQKAKAAA